VADPGQRLLVGDPAAVRQQELEAAPAPAPFDSRLGEINA
jgi:hypothetical protein